MGLLVLEIFNLPPKPEIVKFSDSPNSTSLDHITMPRCTVIYFYIFKRWG